MKNSIINKQNMAGLQALCYSIKNYLRKKTFTYISISLLLVQSTYAQEAFQLIAGNGANFGRDIVTIPGGGHVITGYSGTPANAIDVSVLFVTSCGIPDPQIQNIGGPANDYGYHATLWSADSTIIIAGETSSFGSGLNDAFIVAPPLFNGAFITSSTLGENLNDVGEYITETSDGNLIVTGRTNSVGAGQYDVFVSKITGDGNILWETVIGGNLNDRGFAVKEMPDSSGYVVAGNTESYGAGQTDMYLIRLDNDGNVLWAKTYGTTKSDAAYDIGITSDAFILSGKTRNRVANSDDDIYVVKTDLSGNVKWGRVYAGANNEVAEFSYMINDTTYLVGGYTNTFGNGKYDGYVLKLDKLGNVLANSTYGTFEASEKFFGMDTTANGGFIFVGDRFSPANGTTYFYVVKGAGLASGCNQNTGYVKYNTNTLMDSGYVDTNGIIAILIGLLTDTSDCTVQQLLCTNCDGKFSNNEVITEDEIRIFPNPASDHLQIAFDTRINSSVKIEITDVTGSTRHSYGYFEPEQFESYVAVNTSFLPPGIYFIKFTGYEVDETLKVVLVK